jgi:hypothetical protein
MYYMPVHAARGNMTLYSVARATTLHLCPHPHNAPDSQISKYLGILEIDPRWWERLLTMIR